MKTILMFSLLAVLSTCGGGSGGNLSSNEVSDSNVAPSVAKITDFQNTEPQQISNRKMIWTGHVEVQVKKR